MRSFIGLPADILSILFKYKSCGVTVSKSDAVFICPIGKGSLSYLHKLYRGFDAEDLAWIRSVVGFRLPPDYVDFSALIGGATLFDNTMFLYGVRANLARSLHLDDQAPVSFDTVPSNVCSDDPLHEWASVGSISTYNKRFNIQISASGVASLQGIDQRKCFSNFASCLRELIILLDQFVDERGLSDDGAKALEHEITAFMDRP